MHHLIHSPLFSSLSHLCFFYHISQDSNEEKKKNTSSWLSKNWVSFKQTDAGAMSEHILGTASCASIHLPFKLMWDQGQKQVPSQYKVYTNWAKFQSQIFCDMMPFFDTVVEEHLAKRHHNKHCSNFILKLKLDWILLSEYELSITNTQRYSLTYFCHFDPEYKSFS